MVGNSTSSGRNGWLGSHQNAHLPVSSKRISFCTEKCCRRSGVSYRGSVTNVEFLFKNATTKTPYRLFQRLLLNGDKAFVSVRFYALSLFFAFLPQIPDPFNCHSLTFFFLRSAALRSTAASQFSRGHIYTYSYAYTVLYGTVTHKTHRIPTRSVR